jgi:hypothetical protein
MMEKKFDAEAQWLYQKDKDKYMGSYEWWYYDAHLDNGYLVTGAFAAPSSLSQKCGKYLENAAKWFPVLPYNPLDFTQVKFSVYDEKGNTIFLSEEDVTLDNIQLPTKENMVIKFNNCQLEMKIDGELPVYTAQMDVTDTQGNRAKADLVFNSLVPPMRPGGEGERGGHTLDAVIDGMHLDHNWLVLAAAAKVNANIAITNKETGNTLKINESGFGYHDKNWGNHCARPVTKGWVWLRIAETDLTVVFCEVQNIFGDSVYPTFNPCVIIHNGNLLTNTEAVDYTKGPAAPGRLGYPIESTITFKPESGIKGTLKFSDLKMLFEMGSYSRLNAKWAMDIESKYGKLKRDGNLLFEFCDFSVK